MKESVFENARNRMVVSQKAIDGCDFAINFSNAHNAEMCGLGMGYSYANEFFIKEYHFPEKIVFVDSVEEVEKHREDKDAELITSIDKENQRFKCLLTESYLSNFKREEVVCSGHTHFPQVISRPTLTDILNVYPFHEGLNITSLFQIGNGIIFFGFPSYMINSLYDQEFVPDFVVDEWLLKNYDNFVFKQTA
jgi:hypothetical protein